MSVAVQALRRGFRFPEEPGYELASDTGRTLQSRWTRERNFLHHTANDWWPVIMPALQSIRAGCAAHAWDGAGSVAVSPITIKNATRLAECLAPLVPIGTPPPDIAPEGDGEIAFSWYGDEGRLFAMSVGPHDKVNYAGQFGEEGADHGWKPLRFESGKTFHETLAEIAHFIARVSASAATRRYS